MWMTLTFPCASASASKRAAVPSVEPSSTRITSYWSAGMDWLTSDASSGSTYSPGL